MTNDAHDLELTILWPGQHGLDATDPAEKAHLESLVLEDTLDGGIFVGRGQLGLEDDTKGTISDNLALSVLQILRLASFAILNLLPDDFWDKVSATVGRYGQVRMTSYSPPMRRLVKVEAGPLCAAILEVDSGIATYCLANLVCKADRDGSRDWGCRGT